MKNLPWKNLCQTAVALLVIGTAQLTQAALPPLIEEDQISGDWGGRRTTWFDRGYDFTFEYIGETISNTGGTKSGTEYQGLGYAALEIDAEIAFGWAGTKLLVSTMWIHGASPGNNIGNELPVSNIDAYVGLRLHEVYLEKDFGKLNLKLGSLLADGDFVASMYRETLINDSFGQNVAWSANALNGGPAYFAAGPGVRLRYDFTDAYYAQAGVYDGDMFDDAGGDTAINQHGLHFELGNGQGWASLYQIGYNGFNVSDGADLPGWYRVTLWQHSTEYDKNNGIKGNGNMGVFISADKLVYREGGDQGLGLFGRVGMAERDRSRFHLTVDAGFSYTGLFEGRDEDILAMGLIWGKHSKDITTTKSHETVVELTYQYQVSQSVFLQPDIQWIHRPSGDSSIDDAWAFGLRFGLTF